MDGGNLTTRCNLMIELYVFYETVSVTLMETVDNFNSKYFTEIISEILGYAITVVNIIDDGG